jgi:hypothetical protein
MDLSHRIPDVPLEKTVLALCQSGMANSAPGRSFCNRFTTWESFQSVSTPIAGRAGCHEKARDRELGVRLP